jgi:hypothetical protein
MTRLETLVHSPAFQQLAEQYRVAPAELHSLRRLVIHATSLTLPIHPPNPVIDPVAGIRKLAVEYFRWLRQVVIEACKTLSPAVEKPADYPVRLTVPAFAPEPELDRHVGVVLLAAAAKEAGWTLASERPIVSEPYANAIGILTQGSNCIRAKDMFKNGLLITALANPNSYPNYRIVVVDVGAYTTDFACFTLNTEGKPLLLSDIDFDTRTTSVPVGMTELDEAVIGKLDPENQRYMRDEAPSADWTGFRQAVYGKGEPYSAPVGEIGMGDEMARIQESIAAFTARLAKATSEFLGSFGDIGFKELILTGGGCTFTPIQRAVVQAAQNNRAVFQKVHLPTPKQTRAAIATTKQQVVTPLEGVLPRGGTALGGTSAYFKLVS